MGSIFSELFNNWVNAFEQEEGKKKPIYLPNAKENYRDCKISDDPVCN